MPTRMPLHMTKVYSSVVAAGPAPDVCTYDESAVRSVWFEAVPH